MTGAAVISIIARDFYNFLSPGPVQRAAIVSELAWLAGNIGLAFLLGDMTNTLTRFLTAHCAVWFVIWTAAWLLTGTTAVNGQKKRN